MASRRGAAAVLAGCLLVAAVALGSWLAGTSGQEGASVGAPVAPSSPAVAGQPPFSPATSPSSPPSGSTLLGGAVPTARDASPGGTGAPSTAAPARISIAALGVEATVEPVGVEADGSMTVPRDGDLVGWYRYGPAPGAPQGSAVLAGHVDTRAGGPGALFRLAELEPGAQVVVTDTAGGTTTYRVTGKERIEKSVLPTQRLFARDVPHRLTIITCGGPFQPELRAYRDNVVVVAEPVSPAPDAAP